MEVISFLRDQDILGPIIAKFPIFGPLEIASTRISMLAPLKVKSRCPGNHL